MPYLFAENKGIPIFRYGDKGSIDTWLTVSGFPDRLREVPSRFSPPSVGYNQDYLLSSGGEENIRPFPGMEIRYNNRTFIFETHNGPPLSEKILLDASGSVGDVSYTACRIQADEGTEAWLHINSPWYCKIWLNGKLLFPWTRKRIRFGHEIFPVILQKGYNDLLLKFVSFDGRGKIFVTLSDVAGARNRLRNAQNPTLEIRNLESIRADSYSESNKHKLWQSKLLVDLRSVHNLFTEVDVRILVVDVYDRVVAETLGHLGIPLEIEIPGGSYHVYAFVKDFFGRRITSDAGLLACENSHEYAQDLVPIAHQIQSRSEQIDSKGWINYLVTKVNEDLGSEGDRDSDWELYVYKLEKWLRRLEPNPSDWIRQFGWFEWAYLSGSDGSGQPFLIQVPENYDPGKLWPLIIDLHGGGSDHLYYPWRRLFGDDPLAIHMSVLGRGRGGYRALAEVDVLEALEYVKNHWNIDPDRIHLSGHSMGGSGTFWIGSRHPHLFATARPMAGFGTSAHVENMLHVPLYAIHSIDDPVVPVSESRMLIQRIRKIGGKAMLNEPEEAGHALWRTDIRDIRSAWKWTTRYSRITNPQSVIYSATDELARKAYWVEVVEWGKEGRPASVHAVWGDDSILTLKLKNVNVLTIDLQSSPVDSMDSVIIEIDNKILGRLNPPLPHTISLARTKNDWTLIRDQTRLYNERPHFPGGAMALYHGEPMMVVYGTGGDTNMVESIKRMAEATSRSSRPGWPFPEPWEERPRMNMPIGGFPCKPDTAVSDDDMKAYNLFVIGNTDQNTVAAQLAPGMPVSMKGDSIITSDGFSWSFRERAFGLLYLNPIHPNRLVYWAASPSQRFYRYFSPLISSQNMTAPPDFILMDAQKNLYVAARRFDSHWNWEKNYADSPFLKEDDCTSKGLTSLLAEAIFLQTGADFVLLDLHNSSLRRRFSPEESRYTDVLSWEYDQRVSTFEISGEKLSAYVLSFGNPGVSCQFLPSPNPKDIKPERIYRIAMLEWRPNSMITYALMDSDIFPEDGGYIRDALKDFFSTKNDNSGKNFQ